jgi:NTE family protein
MVERENCNFWSVWYARLPVTMEVSPYLFESPAESMLRKLLHTHLDLENIVSDPARRATPKLYVGATDVRNGSRVIFEGETLTYDDLIASAAVPPLFKAINSDHHLYWDGLFTTNPPVREFADLKPDEIWVVQINPQRREHEPRTMQQIVDRRNELAGNLSLGQELYFVDKINQLLKSYSELGAIYRQILIRVVELDRPDLDYQSKLDRSSTLIEGLLQEGEKCAELFFDSRSVWPRGGSIPKHSVRPRTSRLEQPTRINERV